MDERNERLVFDQIVQSCCGGEVRLCDCVCVCVCVNVYVCVTWRGCALVERENVCVSVCLRVRTRASALRVQALLLDSAFELECVCA